MSLYFLKSISSASSNNLDLSILVFSLKVLRLSTNSFLIEVVIFFLYFKDICKPPKIILTMLASTIKIWYNIIKINPLKDIRKCYINYILKTHEMSNKQRKGYLQLK